MRGTSRTIIVPGSAGSAGGAPTDATYITQTANGSLSNEQALAALASGVVKNTTATGVLSVATVDTAEITDDAVTYAKMQNVSATSRILGRKTAAAGNAEECTLSEVLDFVGSAAEGDLFYRGAATWTRLGKGTAGQVLKQNAALTAPEWGSSKAFLLFGAGGSVGHSPADATTYFFGPSFSFDPSSASDGTVGIIMPACTVAELYINMSVLGSAGNSSALTTSFVVRKNAATDSTAVTVTSAAGTNAGQNTSLGFSISAGDRVYIKFTTPTWLTTNPTAVFYSAALVVSFP